MIETLLGDDGGVASRSDNKTGMSDRALRRLFDRLLELGASAPSPKVSTLGCPAL
ncbi:DUF1403 family protein [Mesorhizobium sp. M1312]|uniref:hypothetical protein n=1 Tax=unclassified Mesorhizobium TaxID=325217 RepID=UPI00333D02A3